MKQETKEKVKAFFTKGTSFERRMSLFFSICFAILTVHTLYMSMIMDEIKSLDFDIQTKNDYSVFAYDNTEKLKELLSFNSGSITHFKYEGHGTYTTVWVMPENITDETVVSFMDGEEFLKAERDGDYFRADVSNEPEFVIIKTEDQNGTHTDKIFLTKNN